MTALSFALDPDAMDAYDAQQVAQVRRLIVEREAAYARGDRIELRRVISLLLTYEERFLDMAKEGD